MKKIVLITGSTKGIGKSTAFVFAKNNYTVILNGRNQTDESKQLICDIKALSSESAIFYFDVSNQKQVKKQFEEIITKYKRVDVLINNAGIVRDKTFLKMNYEEWDEVIQTNLYGAFNTTKEMLPLMIQNGFGRVINISSIMGEIGNFGQTNYSASKAALLGFTKALAKEVSSKNITVNAVCPGLVETEMTVTIPEEYLKKMLERIPMRRMAKSEEIGEVLLFLASERSSYITGATFDVNGGWL
ncbi:MAG: beta-ketoacyl-ACP reductase [Candidatus Levybacteria bacterium]|nr:beta-ketoacyl-ACP reductase [Candidatus Levybacteria bacterium]